MGRKKRTPGIYERGNKWIINTTYKGHRIWDTCATPEMAETNLRKEMTLIDEGRWLDKKHKSTITLREFAPDYLAWCASIRQKDLRTKKQRIGLILEKLGKDTQLSQITRATVESYQSERLSSLSQRLTPLKPATVNREMAALKHMLSKAVEWGKLDHNPASRVKLQKENNRRLRYLTPEEYQALLDACPTQTIRRIVILAVNTGMRKSEILNLTWESVNLRQGFIELIDQKNGERSTIPLTPTAHETLSAIPPRLRSQYVFTGKTPNTPFCDLKRPFEKAVKDAKLEGVTFHILRHTCASHLVMAGVNLKTVKEILRHKSIEMTDRYAHLSPDHMKSAMTALESALKNEPKTDAKEA